jgi:hypothetical protein
MLGEGGTGWEKGAPDCVLATGDGRLPAAA